MATIYDLKPKFQALLRPLAASLAEAGVSDSRDAALTYMKRIADGRAPDELIEQLIESTAVSGASDPLAEQVLR